MNLSLAEVQGLLPVVRLPQMGLDVLGGCCVWRCLNGGGRLRMGRRFEGNALLDNGAIPRSHGPFDLPVHLDPAVGQFLDNQPKDLFISLGFFVVLFQLPPV